MEVLTTMCFKSVHLYHKQSETKTNLVADTICNKTIRNKYETYSLSVATLSLKMEFNFLSKQ